MRRALPALLCALATACSAGGPGAGDPMPPTSRVPGVRIVGPDAAPVEPLEGFLPFFYDLYTFRGDSGVTRVVAAFAVPAGRLHRERDGRRVRYLFDVTLVLADTARGTVIRTDDSVSVHLRRPPSRHHLLYTQVELEAPPSENTVQRVIMTDASTPGRGQLYESAFPIDDYRGDRLMLSDIALGQPDVEGGWVRGDVALALLPTRLLPERAFDVYYEIYNLPAGTPYVTEIAVEEMPEPGEEAAGRAPPTRLRFTGTAEVEPDGLLQELRRVDTSLPRGRYRLTVRITNQATGAAATRSRLFYVRGWEPGATLVPALPRGLTPEPADRAGTGGGSPTDR